MRNVPRERLRVRAALGGLVALCLIGAVLAGSSPRAASAAAPLFSDGFESGTMSLWRTVKGVTLQHNPVHSGSWAASITSTGAGKTYATANLSQAAPEVTVSAWIDVQNASTTVVLLRLRAATGTPLAWVGVQKNGTLFTSPQGGPSVISTTLLPKQGWHLLALHLRLRSGPDALDVSLDGTPVSKLSTAPSISSTTVGRFDIGETGTNRKYSVVFDDVSADVTAQSDPPPAAPTHLKATALPGGAEELTWDDNTESDLAGYTVYRFEGNSWTTIGSPTTSRYVDGGLDPSTTYTYAVDSVDDAGQHSSRSGSVSGTTLAANAPPISHVVIIDMENHSFDNVLGKICAEVADGTITGRQPCDGVTTGVRSDGTIMPLAQATDVVGGVDHSVSGQRTAIDGGAMDGFDQIDGCRVSVGYRCMSQYDPSQIPNLAALAETYVISDRTFSFTSSPSWAGHMVLASADQDGFQGDIPQPSTYTTQKGPGWGCDSFRDTPWWDGTQFILVPSCVPDRSGAGPYRTSPVPFVPTIMDRLDGAGLSWRIYGSNGGAEKAASGYGWAICPTFYECLGSAQRNNWVPVSQAAGDAAAGKLPNFSILAPTDDISQHNNDSMALGDDWLGSVVGGIESGPDWPTTAIFITYDDCGCFYDHVPPAFPGWGLRVPMVIVSPYAVPGGTDSQPANFASMLTYTEHLYGLAPLSTADADGYDYSGSFDYGSPPSLAPIHMVKRGISQAERDWIEAHPGAEDDPT